MSDGRDMGQLAFQVKVWDFAPVEEEGEGRYGQLAGKAENDSGEHFTIDRS